MNRKSIKEAYDRDGVVRIRELLSTEEVDDVRSAIERYQRDVMPGVPESDRVMEADGQSVRNMWRMEKHDPFFADFARQSQSQELAAALLESAPICYGVETFLKPARSGSGVPPHQDNAYFCLTPPHAFTLWIAIDAATEANGAVQYLMGSHRQLLPACRSGVPGNSMGLAGGLPTGYQEFSGTLSPGDALVHHCQTVHWSQPNNTDQPRRGVLVVYRGENAREDATLQSAYQQKQPDSADPRQ